MDPTYRIGGRNCQDRFSKLSAPLTLPLSRWTIQMTSKASDWVIIMLHFKYIGRNGTIPKDTFHLVARRIIIG